jgi:hypothetical protein
MIRTAKQIAGPSWQQQFGHGNRTATMWWRHGGGSGTKNFFHR